MGYGRTSGVIRQIIRVFQDGTLAGLSDREVLVRFVDDRDEAAFEALLSRHGPMVLNVCRQVLRDPDDVEDAFQATFLALACKASSLWIGESLGPWLYRVASRVAARARADRRRRGDREKCGGPSPELLSEPDRRDPPDGDDIPRIVHEELGRLPERLRAPVVLCHLEGMTHEQAAGQLGCPVGTIRSRLARARALLHGRFARRGIVTSAGALGTILATDASASALPMHLQSSLVRIATRLAAGTASTQGGWGPSARVVALLEGVLNVWRVKKLVGFAAAMAMVGAIAMIGGPSILPASGQTHEGAGPRPVSQPPHPALQGGGEAHPEWIVKTYYVGDLLLSPGPDNRPPGDGGDEGSRRWVDMTPLVDLITSTAAKGTWIVNDGNGEEIRTGGVGIELAPASDRSARVGRITPFFLSISLIIRHTAEGHEEVADLLRKLRRLVNPPGTIEEEERLTSSSDTKPSPLAGYVTRPDFVSRPAATPKKGKAAGAASPDRNARIRRLLDDLRQEVEKLPGSGD